MCGFSTSSMLLQGAKLILLYGRMGRQTAHEEIQQLRISPDGAGRESQSNLPEVVSKQILSISKDGIPSPPWATLFIKYLLQLFVADNSLLA